MAASGTHSRRKISGTGPAVGERKPTLTIISGRPGSGKTTLAHELAHATGFPLISRDEINEGIYHTFEHDPELASKDSVAKLTFHAFFETIALLANSNVSFIAEAAFQDFRWRIGLEPLLADTDIRIVQCVADPEVAHERFVRRRLQDDGIRSRRHLADASTIEAQPPALRPFEPLSLPVPSIRVATNDGYEPWLPEIVDFIRAQA